MYMHAAFWINLVGHNQAGLPWCTIVQNNNDKYSYHDSCLALDEHRAVHRPIMLSPLNSPSVRMMLYTQCGCNQAPPLCPTCSSNQATELIKNKSFKHWVNQSLTFAWSLVLLNRFSKSGRVSVLCMVGYGWIRQISNLQMVVTGLHEENGWLLCTMEKWDDGMEAGTRNMAI